MPHEFDFNTFSKQSGFKVLSLARLTEAEYSLTLYLINCAVSGLDQLITTDGELSQLIGYDLPTINDALDSLSKKNIVRLHFAEQHHRVNQSLRLGLQFNVEQWRLGYEVDATSNDAVVFPFRRKESPSLSVISSTPRRTEKESDATWQRIVDSFTRGRDLSEKEVKMAAETAKVLIQTHPVDQVLLMIRHFGAKIPTLSLLASSWSHFQEIFDEETHRIDFQEARSKHKELDDKLREQAQTMYAAFETLGLTEDEKRVLAVIAEHRHPRRQLFWAYQMRTSYPNLAGFFADNAALMLGVTSDGHIVKR